MTHWLISANTKLYNHYKSFKDHGFIDWKMSSRYHVGDIVYVYSSMPIQKIQYKTVVEEINMRFSEIRDDREYWKDLNAYNIAKSGLYARFRLLERIDGYELSIEKLKQHGLKQAPQHPTKLSGALLEYIEKNFQQNISIVPQKLGKNNSIVENIYPDEIDCPEKIFEGAQTKVMVNTYERNSKARAKCIELKGTHCYVCGMNFEQMYGEIGKGFIHIHHLVPISKIGKEYQIDYQKDLIPVCPNCHAMLHRKKLNGESPSVEELKKIIRKRMTALNLDF